jgi:hypothetical protein
MPEVMLVAAANPRDPYRSEQETDRPMMSPVPAPASRSRWLWLAIAVVVIAAIGVLAYALLSSGGTGGNDGGGGGNGGLYFLFAFSGETFRRATRSLRR